MTLYIKSPKDATKKRKKKKKIIMSIAFPCFWAVGDPKRVDFKNLGVFPFTS